MVKARSTLVILLLFMWTTAPALRCVLPNQFLTPEEQACCKAMAGQCGEMGNHPCCKKVEGNTQPAIAAMHTSAPRLVAGAMLPVLTERLVVPQLLLAVDAAIAPSPPSPTVSTAILRI
ncbi:MAG TPA: hypothetical protein VG498_00635 [Terriglobales bacterium]|nr:hypothetical protein [Terriglobales bacterium]